jgi:four helix bundle protein
MGVIDSFENLECWKACTELRRFVMKVIKNFPAEEKYELVSQMRRSSRSTTHNIAEGYGRFHFKENVRFCRMSKGSLMELQDQFIVSLDEKYITQEEYELSKELISKSVKILNGYINYLRKAESKPGYVSDVEDFYLPEQPTTNN